MRRLFNDIFVFCLPASLFLRIHIIGKMFLCEFVILACFVPLLSMTRARALSDRHIRTYVILGLLWLAAQVVTDLSRGSAPHNYLRGWALIFMTVMNFFFLVMLVKDDARKIRIFYLGLICGEILTYLLNPEKLAVGTCTDNYWKFGLAMPVTCLCAFMCLHPVVRRSKRRVAAVFFAMAVLNMQLGFRSLGGVSFASAVFILSRGVGVDLGRRTSWGRPLKLLCAGAFAVLTFHSLSWVYNFAINHALTNYSLVAKNIEEGGNHGLIYLLLAGRPEMYVWLHAIKDSPIIGHGSWASSERYAEMPAALRAYGFTVVLVNHKSDIIPTHSHLFGAWVSAGIMGAVFWGWVLCVICKSLLFMRREDHELYPIAILMSFAMLWDIFFSPYSFTSRIAEPFYMVMLFTILGPAQAKVVASIRPRRLINGRTPSRIASTLSPVYGSHGPRANI